MQGVTAISREISCSWAPRLQNSQNRWAKKWGPTCDRDISNFAIYTTAIYRAYTVFLTWEPIFPGANESTHCSLLIPHGIIKLNQLCFRKWLAAITFPESMDSSVRCSSIHQWAISQEMLNISTTKNFPGPISWRWAYLPQLRHPSSYIGTYTSWPCYQSLYLSCRSVPYVPPEQPYIHL